VELGLEGRTALITGASAGIGIGIAEALAEEGVRLVLAGRNRAALEAVAAELENSRGGRPAVVVGELTDPAAPARIAREAAALLGGPVDILVNNAGGSRPLPAEANDAFWEEARTLNFEAPRRLTEALLPAMRAAGWGRVVNLTGALYGKALNAAGPQKAALLAWSRALAFTEAPHGITVNCVAPGRIDSVQIRERLHPTAASREAFIRDNIPMGRFGEPRELGDLVAFLCSPRAGYISGAHIPVDGGAVRMAV
jgi:3-oxoacyl-[acyl-carrier protein] reductase